jgi:hypothetical protein
MVVETDRNGTIKHMNITIGEEPRSSLSCQKCTLEKVMLQVRPKGEEKLGGLAVVRRGSVLWPGQKVILNVKGLMGRTTMMFLCPQACMLPLRSWFAGRSDPEASLMFPSTLLPRAHCLSFPFPPKPLCLFCLRLTQ